MTTTKPSRKPNESLTDSGVLYALVDPDDQHNSRAQAELREIERSSMPLLVSYPHLLECYSLVLQRLGTRVAHRWLGEVLFGIGLLETVDDDYQQAIGLAKTYTDQKITLFDMLLAVLSKRLKLPIWTFDSDFDIMRARVWR